MLAFMPFPGRKEMENMDMVVLHLHLPSWPSRPSQAHLGDVWRQVGSAAVLASKYGHPAIWLYPMQQLGKQFWCPMKRAILLAATSTHPLVTIISYLSWNSIYSVSVWPFNFQRTSLHYIMSTPCKQISPSTKIVCTDSTSTFLLSNDTLKSICHNRH